MCNHYVNTGTTHIAEDVLLLKETLEACKRDQHIYPDTSPQSSVYPVGWVCPKCGSCYSPYVSSCPNCVESTSIKITY